MNKKRIGLISGLFLMSFILITSQTILPATAVAGRGTLFGTDASGTNLLQVNINNGATFVVGSTGLKVPALAVDPFSGTIYAGEGAGSPFLYTVDKTNGQVTFVGDTQTGFAAIGDMDFDPSGTLYATINFGGGGADLVTIDTTTGLATLVGSYQVPGIEAIAFTPDGTLYGAYNKGPNSDELHIIDKTNAQTTFVALIVDVTGAPHPGSVSSLQFDCNETLYAGTGKGNQIGFADLIKINPTTGVYTTVGQAINGQFSLGALAFSSTCVVGGEVTPIDSTSLVIAGLHTSAMWMLPAIVGIAGIGFFLVKTQWNKTQEE